MRNKALREVSVYLVSTIFLSFFIFWGPIAVFKIPTVNLITGASGPLWAIILFMIGGFVPSLNGIFLTAVYEGKKGVKELLASSVRFKLGLKWFALVIAVVACQSLFQILINAILGEKFDWSQFWVQLPFLLPLIILGPLSEEYGWRGFAIKRLLKCTNAVYTSLVIGVIWSLWHLPLFHILGSNQYELQMPFLPFLLTVTSSSFVYTYVYLRTNRSVFSAIFVHWVYTYAIQVVSSGIVRTNMYNWLESVPALLIGFVFLLILIKEKPSADSHIDTSNPISVNQ